MPLPGFRVPPDQRNDLRLDTLEVARHVRLAFFVEEFDFSLSRVGCFVDNSKLEKLLRCQSAASLLRRRQDKRLICNIEFDVAGPHDFVLQGSDLVLNITTKFLLGDFDAVDYCGGC